MVKEMVMMRKRHIREATNLRKLEEFTNEVHKEFTMKTRCKRNVARAIKLSIAHWERICALLELMPPAKETPNINSLISAIGEGWSSIDCALCSLYTPPLLGVPSCPSCPLSCTKHNSNYMRVVKSKTVGKALKYARNLITELKGLLIPYADQIHLGPITNIRNVK